MHEAHAKTFRNDPLFAISDVKSSKGLTMKLAVLNNKIGQVWRSKPLFPVRAIETSKRKSAIVKTRHFRHYLDVYWLRL